MPFPNKAGRPKGSKNKVTEAARAVFLKTFQDLEPNLKEWIERAADDDPARAAEILVRMAEYHFPKLGRTELSGPEGEPLTVNVVQYAPAKE